MNNVYDSRNPAPGVRVAPCIKPKVFGLTMSQAKQARQYVKVEKYKGEGTGYGGVLRPARLGGPIGLGMPSTVRISRSEHQVNKATIPPGHRKTPGSGLRGHCKAPRNMVFQGAVWSNQQRGTAAVSKAFDTIKSLHWQVVIGKVSRSYYWQQRAAFIRLYGEMTEQLKMVELAHAANFHGGQP